MKRVAVVVTVLTVGWILRELIGGQVNLLAGEPSWIKVTDHAAFHVRDSAGEVVYDGKMWILGGWCDSFDPNRLKDVWSSSDGVTWTCATSSAPWSQNEHPVTLVFDNKMWFMSGWYNGRLPGNCSGNEVWYSTNGADWIEATSAAPWAARLGAAGAVFNDKMWILGGVDHPYAEGNTLFNDVWSSSDGVHWDQVATNAPWSPRAYHQVLVFDNKLWVLGGGNYLPNYVSFNDMWNSSDGVNWTKVTDNAPWNPRIWYSAEVYDGRMWVMGGSGNDSSDLLNDVWSSTDGINWTQLQTDAVWSQRHELSVYVHQGKMWVVAGWAKDANGVVNDVWRISIPAPEPSSMTLLGVSLAALFAMYGRRRITNRG